MERSVRNDALSKSLAVTERSSKRFADFEVQSSRVGGSGKHNRATTSIDIKEIVSAGQRCAGKIGITFVPTLEKTMTYTFQKDQGKRDFVNAIQRMNATKLAPNHYKPFDADGFIGSENLSKVRFAFGKDKKFGIIEAEAK